MIECKKLCKSFNSHIAVDSISFHIPPGQILALLGPNGAGKTTTVRMLSCLITPDSGDAMVAGYSILSDKDKIRSQVGLLTENPSLYDKMRIKDYLVFFARLYGMPAGEIQERVGRFLRLFGLSEHAEKRIGNFSKGMKQKVALARALLHDPKVIFLDEPTSGLDPESAKILRDYVISLKEEQKRTFLLCTHNLDEAQRLSDWIGIIDHGRLRYFAKTQDIIRGGGASREFHIECVLDTTCTEVDVNPAIRGLERIPGVDGVSANREDGDVIRITFSTKRPETTNPEVLRSLMGAGFGVVTCEESAKSLEEIYMTIIKGDSNGSSSLPRQQVESPEADL